MPPEGTTRTIAIMLLASLALSGCISSGTASQADPEYTGPPIDNPLSTVAVSWEGKLRTQGCYEGGVDTCDMQLKSEDHVEWFEVELPGTPLAGELQVEWEARDFPETGVYLTIECWDHSIAQCGPDAPDLARDEGTEAPLSISVGDLSFLDPNSTLYVAFGVPARDTAAGDYHPGADIDFVIDGAFLLQAGEVR